MLVEDLLVIVHNAWDLRASTATALPAHACLYMYYTIHATWPLWWCLRRSDALSYHALWTHESDGFCLSRLNTSVIQPGSERNH